MTMHEDLAAYLANLESTRPDEPEEMTLAEYQAMYANKVRGRANQKRGKQGEKAAGRVLRECGVLMVEEKPTPYRIVAKKQGGWVKIIRDKKVSGDWGGIMPDGRRVLAEVKTVRAGDRVIWSKLKAHQIKALNENNENGGISLLVVVFVGQGAFALRWPVPGFGRSKSISFEEAVEYQWGGVSQEV